MDVYFENGDTVYEKFQTKSPKELVCLRGIYASMGQLYVDSNGHEWVHIKRMKTSISSKTTSQTFTQIKLFKPMFTNFLKQLNEAKNKAEPIEITFYRRIERYEKDGNRNINEVAVLRRQFHFENRDMKK